MNISENMFDLALQIAVQKISEKKQENPTLRFRLETCVRDDHVKVYVIHKEKIVEVITIDENKVATRNIEGGQVNGI